MVHDCLFFFPENPFQLEIAFDKDTWEWVRMESFLFAFLGIMPLSPRRNAERLCTRKTYARYGGWRDVDVIEYIANELLFITGIQKS